MTKHRNQTWHAEMQEIKSTEDTAKARKQKIQEDEEDWTSWWLWFLWFCDLTSTGRNLLCWNSCFPMCFPLRLQDVQAEISKLQEDLAHESDAQKKRLTEHQYEATLRCNKQMAWWPLKTCLKVSKLCRQKWKEIWKSKLRLDTCQICQVQRMQNK